jgi:DNA helicase-2/ATP-dependent DNA helicase PcrA
MVVYGLFFKIFDRPSHQGSASRGLQQFRSWTLDCIGIAEKLIANDKALADFVSEKKNEIATILADYEKLLSFIERKRWNIKDNFRQEWRRSLADMAGLSMKTKKLLGSQHLGKAIEMKEKTGRPFTLEYVINRVTSVDWSILDLFYQLNAFKYFRNIYRLAEEGVDEGPVCNLGLITQYLVRFMEERTPMITAAFLYEKRFIHSFFSSFTYAIFRLGESEYEYVDDPFPKGRVPFLTIHQAKGLEFPIVVLGSAFKTEHDADMVEVIIRDLLKKEGEPLDRISHFDNMRMFYVALSRAKNLTIIPHFQGRGQRTSEPFKTMLRESQLPTLQSFNIDLLPDFQIAEEDLGRTYSYTGDYLGYLQCPRNYMLFKKYGFIPSRSQTMFFGSLVHQTIEDLHYLLIDERSRG